MSADENALFSNFEFDIRLECRIDRDECVLHAKEGSGPHQSFLFKTFDQAID